MNELDNSFAQIIQIIADARDNAYRKVNEELILMYQKVGQFLSDKSKDSAFTGFFYAKIVRLDTL